MIRRRSQTRPVCASWRTTPLAIPGFANAAAVPEATVRAGRWSVASRGSACAERSISPIIRPQDAKAHPIIRLVSKMMPGVLSTTAPAWRSARRPGCQSRSARVPGPSRMVSPWPLAASAHRGSRTHQGFERSVPRQAVSGERWMALCGAGAACLPLDPGDGRGSR